MTEQLHSDTVRENELICEKLLGWKRFADPINGVWWGHDGIMEFGLPSFTTWAEAGLILDALSAAGIRTGLENLPSDHWAFRIFKGPVFQFGTTGPIAIRAAALDYIKQSIGWHTYLKAVKS